MNQLRDPDVIIAAWLEDGPDDLPAAPRRSIVVGMRAVSRRRPGPLPGGIQMPSILRLAVAAALVVAVGAITRTVIAPRPAQVGITGPSESASPTAASPTPHLIDPSRTPSPLVGTASTFVHPFTYRLPADAGLIVDGSDPTWYQFRVPIPGTEGYGNAVIVRRIAGGRVDPCSETSPGKLLGGGPDAVIRYLEHIPQLIVTEKPATTVGGLTASSATFTPKAATPACPDLWLWAEEGSFTQNGSWDTIGKITVVDVGGDHIIFMANTHSSDMSWFATAQEFIDSVKFE
jgi:hypothetical protein